MILLGFSSGRIDISFKRNHREVENYFVPKELWIYLLFYQEKVKKNKPYWVNSENLAHQNMK
jgi:hypothetical protein